uniref:Integrase catalytic domain-containing protein n=1 Tax=Tanacetum cinerariifolium TaxID=118510 RepID=A0A6L2MPT7_TANCI|nr:hypothetical protein [Tanacetum cinerariifolium]
MHPPKKKIEEAVRSAQLSHLIKELKQGSNKSEHSKTPKKGEVSNKEKALSIFMVQLWQREIKQKVTQSFSAVREISCPPLKDRDRQEILIVIEAKIEGHHVHRIERSTSTIMNFMVIRSSSPYNGIIGQPSLRKIQAVPSIVHGMLKFPVQDGAVTLHSNTMAKAAEEKTAFHTSQGVYCYTKMLSDLKNAGATYQRLVDKAFKKQIRRNLEVYVDDLVIKGHTEQEILRYIEETFQNLRKIKMKLNPKKCTFGVEEGMFLSHVVNMKGIKACLEKAAAVIKLKSPRMLKDVQSLNGKLAKAEKAFQDMKRCITKLPMVTTPRLKEELIMYFCAAREATSKVNYRSTEKLMLPLVHALRRLRSYLQAYPMAVITDQQIKQILSRPKNIRRMLKWKFKLEAFNITYRPMTSIRGQVLADFIAERLEEDSLPIETQVEEAIPDPCREEKNKKADALSKIASTSFAHLTKQVLVEVLKDKLNKEKEILAVVEERILQHALRTEVRSSKGEIISDNGKQFKDNPFKDWCEKLNVKQRFASFKHPQTNGHVERANRSLGEGIKVRTKAVMPVEIGMPSLRCATINQAMNDEALLLNLDILEEERDFVYRNNEASHAKDGEKLGPKWEGPYEVVGALGKGAYKIMNSSGDILPRTWNVKDMKKCYL